MNNFFDASFLKMYNEIKRVSENMKRILTLTLLILLASTSFVCARVKYDSTGRHIIYDDTIRGRQRAAAAQEAQQRRMEAAAAARLDYEEALRIIEEKPKTNFYQDSIEYKQKHGLE